MSKSTVSYSGKISIRGINYSGQGKFAFKIINENGNVIWQNGSSSSKTISVDIKNGYYTVLLGGQGMNPLPPDLFLKYQNPRLQVWFDQGDGSGLKRLLPDNPISSSPHALSAELARNAIIANSVKSGSVTKDMLSSELLTELSSGGGKSESSVGGNATIDGGSVVAVPVGENGPEGAVRISSGIPKGPKNWKLCGSAGLTPSNPSNDHNNIILADDQIHFIKYQYDYPNWFLKHNVFHIEKSEWEDLSQVSKNGEHLFHVSSVYYEGKIYIIGGSKLSNENAIKYERDITNKARVFDIESKTWSSFDSLPQPTFKGHSIIHNGVLYYSGKILNGEQVNYSFNFDTKSWSEQTEIKPGLSWKYVNRGEDFTKIFYNFTQNNGEFPIHTDVLIKSIPVWINYKSSINFYDFNKQTWIKNDFNIIPYDTTNWAFVTEDFLFVFDRNSNLYQHSIEELIDGSFDLYAASGSPSSGGGGVPENGSVTKNMLNSDLLNELSNPTITLNQLPQEVRDDLNKSITITRSMLPQDVREDLNRTITRNMLPADVLTDLNASVGLNRLSSEVRLKLDQNTSVANGSITASKIANDSINTNHLSENILKYLRPIITSQPQSTDLFMETNMSFSVGVDGRYLSYQWKNNGVDIPGETNSTIHIIDANATLHDGNYTVSVTNDFGSVESTPFELKVVADPVLNGLEGWWRFDSNDSSIAVDSSGNNKHGTLSGNPSRTTGKINGAMSFDGVDDKLAVQHQFFADRSFSILFWFKDVNDFTYFFHQGGGSNGGGRKEFVFRFLPSTNKLTTSFFYDDLNSNYIKETSWTHLGLTYEKSATTRKLYINSNMIISDTDQEHYYGNSEFRLGRMNYSYATVTFDDVRVYNRPITASEVESIFKLGN
jgi:hypothetical protein